MRCDIDGIRRTAGAVRPDSARRCDERARWMMVCPTLAIEAGADAPVSRRRARSEESFEALPCLGLFLVAGDFGGESVSRTAVEMVHTHLEIEKDNPGGVCADEMTAPRCRDEVRLMMSPCRTSGCRAESDCPEPGGHGAQMRFAGVLLAPGAAYMAYVGDMRVYRFRGGKLKERTRDDAVLDGGMLDGAISPDALAMLVQHANAATRALGCEAAVEMKTQVESTEPGDLFLVCSGGVWGAMPEHRITGILAAHQGLRFAASLLMDCAHEHGEPEHAMCILARVGGM
ncbi:PP2C family protein-serine/threonine phosphatase [Sorangium sp. So ce362]|uniref:PP2C family protein-serine/threonine phosphatase n=1 Tax=Sorangium sp. So ce362 TaxID=3133303 RepID=UPI003F5F55D6